jgi:hypothetical protein
MQTPKLAELRQLSLRVCGSAHSCAVHELLFEHRTAVEVLEAAALSGCTAQVMHLVDGILQTAGRNTLQQPYIASDAPVSILVALKPWVSPTQAMRRPAAPCCSGWSRRRRRTRLSAPCSTSRPCWGTRRGCIPTWPRSRAASSPAGASPAPRTCLTGAGGVKAVSCCAALPAHPWRLGLLSCLGTVAALLQ